MQPRSDPARRTDAGMEFGAVDGGNDFGHAGRRRSGGGVLGGGGIKMDHIVHAFIQ